MLTRGLANGGALAALRIPDCVAEGDWNAVNFFSPTS